VKNDFSVLSDQISSALNDFASRAGKEARRNYAEARSGADDMISDWSRRGSALADQAYDTALSFEESLEDTIADRPLAAIGIAAAIGFLVGFTVRR
jgi:ElaB/YqjD/DUF883 family membrane-anchored ribosome-binding protein